MLFDQIVGNATVETQSPCEPTDLVKLQEQLSATIPSALVDFWQKSNGATFKHHDACILGTGEVFELLNLDGFGEWLLDAGFLPIVDDRESNYLCIALKAPLSPRIVYVLHDGSPKLLYQDIDALFEGCIELLASKDFAARYFHNADGDYKPDANRISNDIEAAKALMQSEDDWAISIAIQLLDSTCTVEWHELLNGDRFARQDALNRLRSLSSDAAKRILDRDAEDFEAFANSVCDALKLAAVPFERRQTAVRINRQWMDLNAFFGLRDIDNAMQKLVNWFMDVQNGATPADRPDNYFVDE